MQEQCYERYKSGYEECGFAVDMKPAISSTVLTELHIYLFSAALAHIVTSVIVILMATFRLHMWQHMQGREKDHLLMWELFLGISYIVQGYTCDQIPCPGVLSP